MNHDGPLVFLWPMHRIITYFIQICGGNIYVVFEHGRIFDLLYKFLMHDRTSEGLTAIHEATVFGIAIDILIKFLSAWHLYDN